MCVVHHKSANKLVTIGKLRFGMQEQYSTHMEYNHWNTCNFLYCHLAEQSTLHSWGRNLEDIEQVLKEEEEGFRSIAAPHFALEVLQ